MARLEAAEPGAGLMTAAFSPDEKTLLTADFGDTKIWSVASGECLNTLIGSWANRRNSLVVSPDGQQVLTEGEDAAAGATHLPDGAVLHFDARLLKAHSEYFQKMLERKSEKLIL